MPATYTPNLNLWKGARGDANWDVALNANATAIDLVSFASVRAFGATGDGITDDTSAIQDAIDASEGGVYFPSGIYAISAALELKEATEYRGAQGGTYLANQEHPTAGYGACLKWIGAASGTMVQVYDASHVTWDGIDLDGVDYTDAVQGFWVYSNNNPTTQSTAIRNVRAFNLGTGIRFGNWTEAGTSSQADKTVLDRFTFYMVNYGIIFDGYNASQGVHISNGLIAPYTQGIRFYVCGGMVNINSVFFGGLGNAPGTGCYIFLNNIAQGGVVNITNMQGEPQGGGSGWKDIRCAVGGSFLECVVNLSGSSINGGIVVPSTVTFRLNSKGNYYATYENDGITPGGNSVINSDGDVFLATTDMVKAGGGNNMVTYRGGYEITTGQYLNDEYYYNNVCMKKLRYNGIRTGAATPAGSVTPDFVGEHYIDTTGHKEYVADGLTNGDWYILN